MSSKSSSSNESKTTNIDKRIAAEAGGIVLQTEGSNSTISFEDVNKDVVQAGLELAKTFIVEGGSLFDKALGSTNDALGTTQDLAQGLLEEKNTPSSDNMRKIIYAVTAASAVVGATYFWSRK